MKSILILFVLGITGLVHSQTTSSLCDSLDTYWDNFFSHFKSYVSLTYMDSAPELLTSGDSLFVHLKGEDSLFNKKDTLRVFMKFYVNKDGNPICIKIINNVNIKLESISVRKVDKFKFKPAIVGGKIKIVPMTLPIIFLRQ